MPENSESTLVVIKTLEGSYCIVHSEELVILGKYLCRGAEGVAKMAAGASLR